ncbi:MAG TPA: indolepyruvate oxidoreductase subunit beta [Anaerolineae bacterium]|nr:indolepyruvate oxidoreductase subunit beta [Anaerolineae bacterium]
MAERIYNLLFVGVGGQGVLLVAEISALAAARAGLDVKQTEVHGVSQRGGSVETHVRFGSVVHSPIVTPGQADVVVALENLEALRFAHFARRETGVVLMNDHEIIPGSVAEAETRYPHNVPSYLQGQGFRVATLKASEIARDLGDGRMANIVMLGALTAYLPFSVDLWLETLQARIPQKFRAANLKAFEAGRAACAPPSGVALAQPAACAPPSGVV